MSQLPRHEAFLKDLRKMFKDALTYRDCINTKVTCDLLCDDETRETLERTIPVRNILNRIEEDIQTPFLESIMDDTLEIAAQDEEPASKKPKRALGRRHEKVTANAQRHVCT
eukprot:Lankesteria_metandrocarpae@DN8560_c0_g1_i1.p1